MSRCPFCKLDNSQFYNEIIEETNNFYIIPGLGALTKGYILVLPKKHVYYMTGFEDTVLDEYNNILEKYRNKFKNIYGKYPIIFEHGTLDPCGICANSVIHGHTHIINHNYKNEKEIINTLNMKKIINLYNVKKNNYIYYKSPKGIDYITYDFEPVSQLMRIYVARDLGIEEKYNWRQFPFENNIKKTIEELKK